MTLCEVQPSGQNVALNSDYVHHGRTLAAMLRRILIHGDLVFIDGASGALYHFGDRTGPGVVIGLTAPAARRIAATPELALGEPCVEGTLSLIRGELAEFFTLLSHNFEIQLAKRIDAVPLTRDYVTAQDRMAAQSVVDVA